MQPADRLDRIPPYLFAELERKIAAKRAAGVDVISLGIGDPDRPTPAVIVDAMEEAVSEPGTHQYPSNRGRPEFREAFSDFYARRFDVEIDKEREVIPALGAKECIFNLNLAFLNPGDVALAPDPGYPVYTGGPLLVGADPSLLPLAARARLHPRPRRDPARRSPRRRSCCSSTTPTTPPARSCPRASSTAWSSSRRRTVCSSCTTTPTRRPPSTVRRPLVPGHAGREGGRGRGLLAVQGLQHDRLALRGHPRQRRRHRHLLAAEDQHRLGHVRGGAARRRRPRCRPTPTATRPR